MTLRFWIPTVAFLVGAGCASTDTQPSPKLESSSAAMGTDGRQGAMANIVIGIIGALVGGFVTHKFFGDNLGNNGLLASFGVALLGSCIVIFIWKAVSRSRA